MHLEPSHDWRSFEVETTGSRNGSCECCGTTTNRVWGFVHRNDETVAAFFVTWTQGKPDHGAKFDLILGKWGDSATLDDRYSVALDFRVIDGSPQFMVVDALGRLTLEQPLVGRTLQRSDVIGTPLAPQVFAIVDAIYISDIAREVRQWSEH